MKPSRSSRVRYREDNVYRFFVAYVKTNGISPSIRDICAGTGIPSTSLIKNYLDGLCQRGLLVRVGGVGTARSIRLARKGAA